MEFLILGNMSDLQTGIYIVKTLEEMEHTVTFLNTRKIIADVGGERGQSIIKKYLEDDYKPDVIIVLKGLEVSNNTIKYIKEKYTGAKLVNWMFDVNITGMDIWKDEKYAETIKLYDTYFCSLKGVATKLNEAGLTNVKWLPEACYPLLNGVIYMNNFQKKKYGEDIAFCGTIGHPLHANRLEILQHVASKGFNLAVWGQRVCDWKKISPDLQPFILEETAINDKHSMVAQSSLINLGIDQQPLLDMSFSARIYRIMCAGGFILEQYCPGIENWFDIGKDCDVYHSKEECVDKIKYYLTHEDDRLKIAEHGRKTVIESHTFTHRMREVIKDISISTGDKSE